MLPLDAARAGRKIWASRKVGSGVDREGPVPVLRGEIGEPVRNRRAGVRDEGVEAAENLQRLRRDRGAGGGVGEVAAQVGGADAASREPVEQRLGRRLSPAGGQHEVERSPPSRAVLGEPQRGRAADAVARAGDDDLHRLAALLSVAAGVTEKKREPRLADPISSAAI